MKNKKLDGYFVAMAGLFMVCGLCAYAVADHLGGRWAEVIAGGFGIASFTFGYLIAMNRQLGE